MDANDLSSTSTLEVDANNMSPASTLVDTIGHLILFVFYFFIFLQRVKCLFNTCALSQNQIGTSVFKNITNGTCGYQINPLGTSVKIPLVFLTKCHVTLTHGVVPEFLDATSN
jgi:hypothetical protein